jgi:hypothetical protein
MDSAGPDLWLNRHDGWCRDEIRISQALVHACARPTTNVTNAVSWLWRTVDVLTGEHAGRRLLIWTHPDDEAWARGVQAATTA